MEVVHRVSPVPVHWMAKVKDDLDRDVGLGVLEKVLENTPVRWQSRMHMAPEKDGWCRRTVDLRPLDEATFHQTHLTKKPIRAGLQDIRRHLEVYSGCLEWLPLSAAGQGVQGAYHISDALGEIGLLGEPTGAAHKWRCIDHEV